MKPFLDTGFLLTLLLPTNGSPIAWDIAHRFNEPLEISMLQIFNIENRLQREIHAAEVSPEVQAGAANALQNLRWYLDQQVFRPIRFDYDIAIDLAAQWQRRLAETPPALLLLWPAFAATTGATHFLSFDPRTRALAKSAGLKLLPEEI